MDQRIQLLTAETYQTPLSFFPFVHGGVCSPLSPTILRPVFDFQTQIHSTYRLRLAQSSDVSKLYPLLRSYGNQMENYGDLEQFPENRLALIVRNIATCALHRWFLTFILWDKSTPIAFFQIDFYQYPLLAEIYQKRLLPFLQPCFRQPLNLEDLLNLGTADRLVFLQKNFYDQAFQALYASVAPLPQPLLWLNFIYGGLQTYTHLRNNMQPGQWIGNVSYTLLPSYQHRGIMSEMFKAIEQLLTQAQCYALFADRVAQNNKTSTAFLERNSFQCTGEYRAYLGPAYQTRNHPQGNFSEPCVCFYKEIH